MLPDDQRPMENNEPLPPDPNGMDDPGPFDPPDDFEFEEELQAPSPRPIPAELHRGRHGKRTRRAAWCFLVAGVLCMASGMLPIVKFWGQFFLPLGYLVWIGVGCAAIAAYMFFSSLIYRGPYRYVKDGIPIVARILGLALEPAVIIEGQAPQYCFSALIQYPDPDTGEIVQVETKSNPFSSDKKDRLTTSFHVGDYVTAIYLRSNLAKSLRLYGFLDLKPELGLVERDNAKAMGLLGSLLCIVGIFAFFGVLCWNVYAFGCYAPLDMTFRQGVVPFVVGALLLGGGLLGSLIYNGISDSKKRAVRNAKAQAVGEAIELDATSKSVGIAGQGILMSLILVAGSILLGGLTMLCWCYTANAMFDRSPPKRKPVQITEMLMTTHNFIFREYTIKYHTFDSDETLKLMSTPGHMAQFETDLGFAVIRQGRFGWPWVETIEPITLDQLEALEEPQADDEIQEMAADPNE